MAYTIIEVERQAGIPSTKILFWIKKGLFPLLQNDQNRVRYFSKKDIEASLWVEYLRESRMDIKTIKLYLDLYAQGEGTIAKRKKMIKNQIKCVKTDIARTKEILKILERKYQHYETLYCQPKQCLTQ